MNLVMEQLNLTTYWVVWYSIDIDAYGKSVMENDNSLGNITFTHFCISVKMFQGVTDRLHW